MATARDDNTHTTGTTNSDDPHGGGLGAGGKFQRKSYRRHPATTPYDRPSDGWLGKIVAPARRLIMFGARKWYASLVRKGLAQTSTQPPVSSVSQITKQSPIYGGSLYLLNKEANPGVVEEQQGAVPAVKSLTTIVSREQEAATTAVHSVISSSGCDPSFEVEEIFKQDTFSRTIDEPIGHEEKVHEVLSSKPVLTSARQEKLQIGPLQDKLTDGQKRMNNVVNSRVLDMDIASPAELAKAYMGHRPLKVGPAALGLRSRALREDSTPLSLSENIASSAELAKAYMGYRPSKLGPAALGLRSEALREDSTPLSLYEDDVSPVELAKAYMADRPSKVGPAALGLRSRALREDSTPLSILPGLSKSPMLLLVPKSVTYKGVHDDVYVTPRSHGRSAIYRMARTPYSRIRQSATFKSAGPSRGNHGGLSLATCSLDQSGPFGLKGLKKSSGDFEDSISSFGPIRRTRQKPSLSSNRIWSLATSGKQQPPSSTQKVLSMGAAKRKYSNGLTDENIDIPGRNMVSVSGSKGLKRSSAVCEDRFSSFGSIRRTRQKPNLSPQRSWSLVEEQQPPSSTQKPLSMGAPKQKYRDGLTNENLKSQHGGCNPSSIRKDILDLVGGGISRVASSISGNIAYKGVHDSVYVTPRSHGRSAIYSMARTPYSRIRQSATFKGAGPGTGNHGGLSLATCASDQSGPSGLKGLKKSSADFEDSISSFGPIRRTRQKPSPSSQRNWSLVASGEQQALSSTQKVLSMGAAEQKNSNGLTNENIDIPGRNMGLKRSSAVCEDRVGSFGPIRRTHQKPDLSPQRSWSLAASEEQQPPSSSTQKLLSMGAPKQNYTDGLTNENLKSQHGGCNPSSIRKESAFRMIVPEDFLDLDDDGIARVVSSISGNKTEKYGEDGLTNENLKLQHGGCNPSSIRKESAFRMNVPEDFLDLDDDGIARVASTISGNKTEKYGEAGSPL